MITCSIIMPLYNCSYYLKQAINSIHSQSYDDWELIIVDDCSTDNSLNIAKAFAKKDCRIKVIGLKQNIGAANARNVAIEAAQGRFIAFLDSDDIWNSQKLQKQINFMIKNDVDISFTAYERIDEKGVPFQTMRVPLKVGYKDLLKTNVMGCLTVVYDTKNLGKVFMSKHTKREDFATWLKILKKVDCAYAVPEVLAQYRVYSNQSSSKKTSMAQESWLLYRNIEKLNLFQATYYFSHYAIRGLLRAKSPKLASFIGIL